MQRQKAADLGKSVSFEEWCLLLPQGFCLFVEQGLTYPGWFWTQSVALYILGKHSTYVATSLSQDTFEWWYSADP